MKFLTFILTITMVMSAVGYNYQNPQQQYQPQQQPQYGRGAASDYCAYNASSARTYKPQSVLDAEKKLKDAQDEQKKLEKRLDKLDCTECEDNFRDILSLYKTENENYDAYIRHLEGGSACAPVATSVDVYNYWALVNDSEPIDTRLKNYTPRRMVAGGNVPPDEGGEVVRGGEEEGRDYPPRREAPEIEPPGPSPECPYFAGAHHSIKIEFCEKARKGIEKTEYKLCRKCIKPQRRRARSKASKPRGGGKYGNCLRETAYIEEKLADLEDQIAELKEELEEAKEYSKEYGEEAVCADCKTDNRSGFSKYGPTLLVGALVGAGAYFGYKQEKKSYDYYKNVIHPDNNAKGYPTSPMQDRSGYRFASTLIGGIPTVVNTGLATGAFGCSGSALFGNGMLQGGTQLGGANGLSGILGNLLGNRGGNQIGGGAYINGGANTGGGQYPPGTTIGAGGQIVLPGGQVIGGNGTTPGQSAAQIQAEIAAQQQRLTQLNAQQSYYNSYNAITQDYRKKVAGLGPYPNNGASAGYQVGGNGQYGNVGYGVVAPSSRSVISGSVNIGANLGVGGNAGGYYNQGPSYIQQPNNGYNAPLSSPNVAPPATQRTGVSRM